MDADLVQNISIIIHSDYILLFISSLMFDIPRYVLSTILCLIVISKDSKRNCDYKPDISVVMSILNGESGFNRIIDNLHSQTLPPLEIIVVNDGSTDRTGELAEAALSSGLINVLIHHDVRCGKAASINHGVRFARGELILSVDDDTVIFPDGVERLASVFVDPNVGIASGNLPIRNKDESIWTSLQALEYMISIEMGRSILDLVGAVSCCSGAFSMFRRQTFIDMGGHNISSAEDLELTIRMRNMGYVARFVRDAVALVDAPVSLPALAKQRERWDFNTLKLRLLMNGDASIFFKREDIANSVSALDFVLFEFIPTMALPYYLCWLFVAVGDYAPWYFFGIYLILLPVYLVNIAVCLVITKQSFNLFDAGVALIFPFYMGIILKCIRLWAYSRELLFSASFRDGHIPERVRISLFGDKYI